MKLAFFDTKPYDKPGFDEHAHAVKAARELHSVLAQLRLEVPDIQPGPGGVGVKAGAVIGFCIKKSKFHSDPSKPFMAPPAAFYTCRSMQLPPMAGKTQKNPVRRRATPVRAGIGFYFVSGYRMRS